MILKLMYNNIVPFLTAISKITNCTKLRDFQYRHLILSIYGNVILNQWKVFQTEQCEFCEEQQNLKHLFWECEKVQELLVWLNDLFSKDLNLSYYTVHVAKVKTPNNHKANYLFICTKFYIYRCKCMKQSLTVKGLAESIQYTEQIDRYNAGKPKRLYAHCKKWATIFPEKQELQSIIYRHEARAAHCRLEVSADESHHPQELLQHLE